MTFAKIEPEVSIFFPAPKSLKAIKVCLNEKLKEEIMHLGAIGLQKKRLFKSCVVFFKVYTMSQSVVFSRV